MGSDLPFTLSFLNPKDVTNIRNRQDGTKYYHYLLGTIVADSTGANIPSVSFGQ